MFWYREPAGFIRAEQSEYTTQTCSDCGHVLKEKSMLPLSVREWICPECGTYHFRDQNAAQNILAKALDILDKQATA